jgi:signal transduction histidine kinase
VKSYLDELRAQGIQDFAAYLDEHPQVVGECLARIRFVDFNKATIDLYHAKSKSTLQQKLDTVLGTKTHPALVKILLAIAQGETQVQAETVNYTVDGTKINVHIDWRVAPGYEATLEKCFVSIKDVTALKTIQTALQRANAELERSNEELERFAYVASHDLREPLRTVTGFLTLLSQNYAAQLTGKAREYVGHALAGAQRMQAMIDALLNLSRVETRGKPLVATDSEAVLSATLNALQARLQETGAEITHDPLPHVMADDAQLGQLFQNLIANALKFRRADVPPKIHLSAEQEGQLWRFSIRDNGIGIAPEESERIFQLFQRLHTEEEYPGLGIGLALCKRIVERHEGQIWMESETGCCTTFFFTLQSGEANQRRET